MPAALAAVCATGTPELLLPLFDLIERHLDDFRDNARRLYGLPGVLLPPHLTTHGRHNHFTARWCLTFWTAGAAWMARLYHEYWRHTGDESFLTGRALPFMRAAAEFYRNFAEHGDFVPSYSPENSPAGEDGPRRASTPPWTSRRCAACSGIWARSMSGFPTTGSTRTARWPSGSGPG